MSPLGLCPAHRPVGSHRRHRPLRRQRLAQSLGHYGGPGAWRHRARHARCGRPDCDCWRPHLHRGGNGRLPARLRHRDRGRVVEATPADGRPGHADELRMARSPVRGDRCGRQCRSRYRARRLYGGLCPSAHRIGCRRSLTDADSLTQCPPPAGRARGGHARGHRHSAPRACAAPRKTPESGTGRKR